MKFNINDLVKIKLTKKGFAILKRNHENFRAEFPSIGEYAPPIVDEEGYVTFSLWEVMHYFGEYVYNGAVELPFETTIEIPIEGKR